MDRGRVKPDSGLYLRSEPNGEVISILHHDEEVEILEAVTFYRVKRTQGEIGFVQGDYVETLPDTQSLEGSSSTLGDTFQAASFHHERFIGEAVRVDRNFIPSLTKIAEFAKQYNVKVWVTSSLRSLDNHVNGAIVVPASKSCHHIGHAIDMNVWCDGKLYNSQALHPSKLLQQPKPVVDFIQSIQASSDLRWGGDFSQVDPVHIDDDFYHKQTLLYTAKIQDRIRQLSA